MRTFLAICLNRILSILCVIFRNVFKKDGTVTPGFYASIIDKHVLDKIIFPKYVIGVTGSSGKGTTTSTIAHILNGCGYQIIWNESGSNLFNAAVTLILNNTNPFTKKVNADVLLLELDESFIKQIFNKNKLTHLVITNITRDQPARNGHVDIIFNKIKNSIDAATHIIINADDPIVNRFRYMHKGNITTYGISRYEGSFKTPTSNTYDAAYCPLCATKLKYAYYHYGHIGNYSCPKCKFSRNPLNYEAKDINLDKCFMTINKSIVRLNKNIFFTAYSTLAAYTLCNIIGIPTEDIQKQLNDNIENTHRMKSYYLGRRKVEMLESKNENALSYFQTIQYIIKEPKTKTIILGFDNVSRRYEFNDLSWLYDVDFELLKNPTIDKIFCIGRFRKDVYNRLIHAKINPDKLILVDDLNNIIPLVKKNSKGTIYTMVCFDMTAILKQKLSEVEHESN